MFQNMNFEFECLGQLDSQKSDEMNEQIYMSNVEC